MRIFFALCLVGVSVAAVADRAEVVRGAPPESPGKVDARGGLAGLARLVADPWQLVLANGHIQLDTWYWGPGRHSIRGRTTNSQGDAESTSGVSRVIYWHPARKRFALLAISWGDLLAEGTAQIGGNTVEFDFDLHSPGLASRELEVKWTFDGPDKYNSVLRETIGTGESVFMADWPYERVKDPGQILVQAIAPPAVPSVYLRAFEPLSGQTWETSMNGNSIRTTVERVPQSEAVYLRVESARDGVEVAHLFDGYLFHQPGTDQLRILVLSHAGGVFEGEASVIDDGTYELALTGYEVDSVRELVVRIEAERDGNLRCRVWSLDEDKGTLRLDFQSAKAPEQGRAEPVRRVQGRPGSVP